MIVKPIGTLIRGDCLDKMQQIPDNSVDMVLVDLPYGTTANKWDSVIDFKAMWAQLRRIAKKNAAMVFFSAQPFTTDLIASNKNQFRYDLVWQKPQATGFLNSGKMPLRNHKIILVFYAARPYYCPQKTPGRPYVAKQHGASKNYGDKYKRVVTENHTGERHPVSVWHCKTDKQKLHPTQKPVDLLERLIKSYTRPGETVLDFTMGSGSTGVAAVNTGRRFIGIERDDHYFDIASARIAAAHHAAYPPEKEAV